MTKQNTTQEVRVADHSRHIPSPLSRRLINLVAVLLPVVGLIAAIVLLWGVAFNWGLLAILGGMYIIAGLGITVGYHRLFTHRSFKAPKPVSIALAIMGSMAVEGPVLQWVATHRKHHQHSDKADDPHSPHTHGNDLLGVLRGIWHAHMGWLFDSHAFDVRSEGRSGDFARYTKDLASQRWCRVINATFPLWVLLGLLIPAALGGLLTMSWTGVLLGFLWGGLVRVLLLHHVTWSINSVCHLWGTRPFRSHDHSRNNAILGVLALGEGWHNNHHAFPTSARHGLRWWEFDLSYLVIRAMGLVGLASEIRVPSGERMQTKRQRSA